MRSLRRIQILCKAGKIICLVLFILSIIGCASCLISLPFLGLLKGFSFDGQTFEEWLAEEGMNMPTLYAAVIVGAVVSGEGIFLTKYNQIFFGKELKEGTPFTGSFVKYMRKVAIVNICVSLGVAIVLAISVAICRALLPINAFNYSTYSVSTIWFGICLLVLSIFIEYPIEEQNAKEESTLPKDDYLE